MKHHRRKPDNSDHADRAGKFKARQRENAEAAGLPDTPANRQRIEDATWLDLAMDNTRTAILRGQTVEVSALERLVAARNSILPSNTVLNVHFIDGSDLCANCRAVLPPPEERERVARQAEPAATAAAGLPVVGVVPLRSVHDHVVAPLKRDEPWRSSYWQRI